MAEVLRGIPFFSVRPTLKFGWSLFRSECGRDSNVLLECQNRTGNP